MSILQLLAILFALTALGEFINKKYIQLPTSIGLLLLSTILSLSLISLDYLDLIEVRKIAHYINSVNFEELLLHGLLCIFLFAGALNIKIKHLAVYKYSIFNFSTIGVIISTIIIGYSIFLISAILGIDLPLTYCFLFGALISPTDAVAVLSILKDHTSDVSIKARINGESLFNDGTAIVLFIAILDYIYQRENDFHLSQLIMQLSWKIIGGLIVGWVCACIVSQFFRRIDSYEAEIIFTLALAVGSYALAEALHVSEPIAVAVAGLIIGNSTRKNDMSKQTQEHMNVFWDLLEKILNAFLFVLIGLELILIEFTKPIVLLSLFAAIIIILARYISVCCCKISFMKRKLNTKRMPILITWAGLRGGISIALALSVSGPYKEIILAMTYVCVIFSIVVQGTTLGKVAKFCSKKHLTFSNNERN